MSQKTKLQSKQSDIIIDSEGNVFISYLWDDLKHLASIKDSQETSSRLPWTFVLGNGEEPQLFTEEYSNCILCPKKCGANRVLSSHPLCGDSQVRVSNVGVSFGDEKSLTLGGGTGIITLSGCPLTCPSCHNPEKSRSGNVITFKDFIDIVTKLYERKANNIQILSPTVHLPTLEQYLKSLKKMNFPLPIVWKSSGYEDPQQLRRFEGLVDIYVPDLKTCKNSFLELKMNAPSYFYYFYCSLKEMFRQVGKCLYDSNGRMQKGIIIRYVKRTDSFDESEFIMSFLAKNEFQAEISVMDNFVSLE